MTVLDIVTVICIGLMIGTEFAVSAFINPILWKLEGGAQTEAILLFARKLGLVMPFWYVLGLALLLAETYMAWRRSSGTLPAIATAIWALVIVFSVTVLVPINKRLSRSQTIETSLERGAHRRWDRLHRLRVLALTAAMVIFLASVQ